MLKYEKPLLIKIDDLQSAEGAPVPACANGSVYDAKCISGGSVVGLCVAGGLVAISACTTGGGF